MLTSWELCLDAMHLLPVPQSKVYRSPNWRVQDVTRSCLQRIRLQCGQSFLAMNGFLSIWQVQKYTQEVLATQLSSLPLSSLICFILSLDATDEWSNGLGFRGGREFPFRPQPKPQTSSLGFLAHYVITHGTLHAFPCHPLKLHRKEGSC